jgi:hypothetical protein
VECDMMEPRVQRRGEEEVEAWRDPEKKKIGGRLGRLGSWGERRWPGLYISACRARPGRWQRPAPGRRGTGASTTPMDGNRAHGWD